LDLDEIEDVIAVPASRANFFEVGLRKPFGNLLRLDASHYWRTFRNYIDDDVFLNTGISFPITFDTARIEGTEVRLEMPRWRGLSSFVSYSNMRGTASSPVTGGLFIEGGEADELRDIVQHFPISQDQRNTVAAQIRFEPHPRVWFSVGARYGSGLPVELEDDDDDEDDDGDDDEPGIVQPIPQAILDKIDFERGRVKPNFSLDFSAGTRIWERNERSMTLQFDVRNATDRLNVINFSGLFSGTALAPGRQATLQIKVRF
jgi:outer membrane receptor protein involved in Fe transport